MEEQKQNIDLSKQLEQDVPQVLLENVNILFLDISSSCTGYSIFKVSFKNRTASCTSAGAIWLPDGDHQEKYHYLFSAVVNYFNIVEQVDYIVAEQYAVNRDRMMGVLVSPEAHGAIKVAAAEIGCKVRTFSPQSWRAELKIKKNEQRDYKEPTKQKVLEFVNIPENIVSNITHKERKTPSDLYDAIALGLGFLKRVGFTNYKFNELELQKHVGVLDV